MTNDIICEHKIVHVIYDRNKFDFNIIVNVRRKIHLKNVINNIFEIPHVKN